MKMKSLLLAIVGLVLMSMQSYAQYVGPTPAAPGLVYDAVTTTSDYVTFGSRLPYYVAPDGDIKAMVDASKMDPSNFFWEFLATDLTTALGLTPKTYADGAVTDGEDVTADPWITENEISVTWDAPAVVGTQYVIRTTERSNPLGANNIAFGCIDATPVTRNIFVLARPSAAFKTDNNGAGCSVAPSTTFNIPLNLTGLGDWDIDFEVSYNGGAADARSYTLTMDDPIAAVNDGNVIAQSILLRDADGTTSATPNTDGLAVDIGADYGYYDVTLTNVSDRISRKSMDPLPDGGVGGSVVGNKITYRIYVTPTPVTKPIQHLTNL